MMTTALALYILALGGWLGGIIFFSFLTTPVVFATLARPDAGKVIHALFSRYYAFGYVMGILSAGLAIAFAFTRENKIWWSATALALVTAVGITFYAGTTIRAQVDAVRSVTEEANPDPEKKAEFDRLHRLSVTLNGAVILLDLAAVVLSATALEPRV